MEPEQLQERWDLLDQKLEQILALNTNILKQNLLLASQSRIQSHSFWPRVSINSTAVIDILGSVVVLILTGSALGDHWPKLTLVLPALFLMAVTIVFVISNVRQLARSASIAWDGPIADIQLKLSQIRQAKLRQFKWIILLSPLVWIAMLVVGFQLLFGENMLEKFDTRWVVANIVFGIFFVAGGLLAIRYYPAQWKGGVFWKKLADGISGLSLTDAQRELNEWAELAE